MIFSAAVVEGIEFREGDRDSGIKIDVIDVIRAFFQADAIQEMFVVLPLPVSEY